MINNHLLTGLLVLGLSGVAYSQAHSFTFLGGIFVNWTLIILSGLGGILSVKGLLTAKPLQPEKKVITEHQGPVWFTVLGLMSYLFIIPVLGFPIASIIWFTLSGVLLSPPKKRQHFSTWLKAFSVGLLVTISFYILFKFALAVPLPKGIMGI